jgi:hypothetical protein
VSGLEAADDDVVSDADMDLIPGADSRRAGGGGPQG